MKPGDTTKLRRQVKATAIPSGSPLSLPAETEVTLTQSLGGSHTVAGSFGLARIEEKDQDALGLAKVESAAPAKDSNEPADGYLCVAGLQGDAAEAGVKMLKFVQEILAFVQKRKAEVEAAGKKYWNIRIGIHSGPLVAGVVGVKRMAYDIWGDTVNVAARIQQGSEPGRINLSKNFRDLLGDRIEAEARGKKPIKHHGEIEMFFFQKLK